MKTTLKRLLVIWLGLVWGSYGYSASAIKWDMEAFEPDLDNVPSLVMHVFDSSLSWGSE